MLIGQIIEEVRQPGMTGGPRQLGLLIPGDHDGRITLLQPLAPHAPQDYRLILYPE
jgi:hypothetical protein